MSDAIREALSRSDVLDDPNVLREDDPPMLRFERTTMENRHKTEETGRYGYKDAIIVHVRSYGDTKTEVPYVAWTTAMVPMIEQVMVEKQVPVIVERVAADGSISEEEEYRKKTTMEERATYEEEEVFPWFDQLDERLRNGRISQRYRDHCRKAFAQWKERGDIPIDGTPVADWRMISPAQQNTLIDAGINTIERVAEMNEDAMQTIGMGARDMKKKAVAFLEAGQGTEKTAAQIVTLTTKLDTEREQRHGLEEKVAELEQMISAQKAK